MTPWWQAGNGVGWPHNAPQTGGLGTPLGPQPQPWAYSPAQMIGAPAMNLGMFGQAAQAPMPWLQQGMQQGGYMQNAMGMYPQGGMPGGMQQGGGMPQQGGGQQQPMGNNYLAAILQALQGAGLSQAQPVNIPNAQNWQLSPATAPTGMPQQAPPITSLGQVQPTRAPTMPAVGTGTVTWQQLVNGGAEGGGVDGNGGDASGVDGSGGNSAGEG